MFEKLQKIFKGLRIGRIIMLTLVSGSTAYGFGGTSKEVSLAGLIGALSQGYFYCVLGIIIVGTIINLIFITKPTPKIAGLTNALSLGVLGMLYVLGMVLGRK